MAEIVDLVPREAHETMTLDELRTMQPADMSDEQFDRHWALFTAAKERVDNPRRRHGGDVSRRGPVIFPPAQY
jgi:hypothetical protein